MEAYKKKDSFTMEAVFFLVKYYLFEYEEIH